MNLPKIYGINNWAAIAGGKNGGVKINFLEKVTLMMNMFVVNPVTTTLNVNKASRLQRKKIQMQNAWVHKQNLHSLPNQKEKLQNISQKLKVFEL